MQIKACNAAAHHILKNEVDLILPKFYEGQKPHSHHSISNKYSVISSLMHRAKDVCSSKQSLEEEQKVIQEALQACKYPPWAINRMKT